jgi:serine/threonine-protein kinase HipA
MAISAASLLGTEYPGAIRTDSWSYPLLAQELKRIGAPKADAIELFDRMVFNAVIGNDDDHPRNHAATYHEQERCWRLSPAYDVVPNAEEHPRTLAMQVASGRFDIARDAVLADAKWFGFEQPDHAAAHLDALLVRITEAFPRVQHLLEGDLRPLMAERLSHGLAALGRPDR